MALSDRSLGENEVEVQKQKQKVGKGGEVGSWIR